MLQFQIRLPVAGTVVAFCGRILALGRWNLQKSWCKCPGVPRGQPLGMVADKCIMSEPIKTLGAKRLFILIITYVARAKISHSLLHGSAGRNALLKKGQKLRTLPSWSTLSFRVKSEAAKEPIKTTSDLPGPISLPIIGTTWKFFF